MAAVVATVVGLWRFPVKAMAGESISHAELGWNGIAGDRRWAFVRGGQERNGFPWLTIRERNDLVRYQPRLADTTAIVRSPDGTERDVTDPALAAELGFDARVIKLDRGAYDTLPISIISVQSLARLGDLVGRELAPERFRTNLLVDAGGDWVEDTWVGKTLQIGAVALRVNKRDTRCVVVNVDPKTGDRDPSILRTIGQVRESCLGVYASVSATGRIAVGDAIDVSA